MNAKDILKAARKRINKPQKWCKRQFISGGRACAGQAIDETSNWQERPHQLARCLLAGEMGGSILLFNDHPRTTHAAVMKAFDRAIRKA